jgi:hypothetical protein
VKICDPCIECRHDCCCANGCKCDCQIARAADPPTPPAAGVKTRAIVLTALVEHCLERMIKDGFCYFCDYGVPNDDGSDKPHDEKCYFYDFEKLPEGP